MHGNNQLLGRRSGIVGGRLEADILKWVHVGGGSDRDGKPITKPLALEQAELIDGICQRYSVLPSALLREDIGLLKMLHLVTLGTKEMK